MRNKVYKLEKFCNSKLVPNSFTLLSDNLGAMILSMFLIDNYPFAISKSRALSKIKKIVASKLLTICIDPYNTV